MLLKKVNDLPTEHVNTYYFRGNVIRGRLLFIPWVSQFFTCTQKIFAFVDCFSLLDDKLGYFAPSSRSQIRMQSKIASNSSVAALFWHTG